MKLTIDGEKVRFEADLSFTSYGMRSLRRWRDSDVWSFRHRRHAKPAFGLSRSMDVSGDVDIVSPLGYLMAGLAFWIIDEKPEVPKYSRPKQLLVTFEHGTVKGYKE